MNSQSFYFFSLLTLFFSLMLIHVPQGSSNPNEFYQSCGKTYSCGNITGLSYPFFNYPHLSNYLSSIIHTINHSLRTMTIARIDLWENTCPSQFINTTLDSTHFNYVHKEDEELSLIYSCDVNALGFTPQNMFAFSVNNLNHTGAFYFLDNEKKNQTPIAVGLSVGGAVLAGIGVGWLIFFCRQKRKRIASLVSSVQTERKDLPILSSSNGLTSSSDPSSTNFTRSNPSYPSSKSKADYGKGSSYFGAHVFSFAELEEATNNFDQSKELGDGGFGVVYYGKLHDGRVVAVKRLYENSFKRVEQFMNEVEILTRLRHKNLVTLYGCTSKRSRDLLLVYEYIPNGTVADHLHGKRAKSGLLSWPVRMNIAIETADALAYLHSSVIIHRDVKTNNILLDNDFHVKVADFGLSRLFPNNVTHVSTAPQGTPGYVDPEYYQCYQLTEKSDVYSFGVVLIELISSLEAVDTNRHRHDINLANMAVIKIQSHLIHELVDRNLGFSTNSSVRRMTTLVAELAFRCLQQEKDLRPSMQEVLETLRGIQNGESKAHKAEVLDIVVDDGGLLKDSFSSPDSIATGK
ncbi:unnamed protein product [Withania somnifera]